MDQLTFSGESLDCKRFDANPFSKQRCKMCGFHIRKHNREAVDDAQALQAIQADQQRHPASLILEDSVSDGKLFQGGFMAVKPKFVSKHRIKRIVNCAKGLDKHFVAWGKKHLPKVKAAGVDILYLDWIDAEDQKLYKNSKFDQLVEAAVFIHQGLKQGESVLVHCAQGKSRSTTATLAYLMAFENKGLKEGLNFVQKRRPMACPNSGFMSQLEEFEGSEILRKLRAAAVK
mmetsp:Transcript_3039/g.5650  ORF Transcript_3039/g.5650 Transcript_3039/m.5650 type:complete len:231 (-) Transcript_3039:224-916(-)